MGVVNSLCSFIGCLHSAPGVYAIADLSRPPLRLLTTPTGCDIRLVGERERANLVMSTADFSIYVRTYVHICDLQCGSTHIVTFTSVLI